MMIFKVYTNELHNGDTYSYFSLSNHKQTEKTRNHVYKGFEGILYGFLHMLCCIVDVIAF